MQRQVVKVLIWLLSFRLQWNSSVVKARGDHPPFLAWTRRSQRDGKNDNHRIEKETTSAQSTRLSSASFLSPALQALPEENMEPDKIKNNSPSSANPQKTQPLDRAVVQYTSFLQERQKQEKILNAVNSIRAAIALIEEESLEARNKSEKHNSNEHELHGIQLKLDKYRKATAQLEQAIDTLGPPAQGNVSNNHEMIKLKPSPDSDAHKKEPPSSSIEMDIQDPNQSQSSAKVNEEIAQIVENMSDEGTITENNQEIGKEELITEQGREQSLILKEVVRHIIGIFVPMLDDHMQKLELKNDELSKQIKEWKKFCAEVGDYSQVRSGTPSPSRGRQKVLSPPDIHETTSRVKIKKARLNELLIQYGKYAINLNSAKMDKIVRIRDLHTKGDLGGVLSFFLGNDMLKLHYDTTVFDISSREVKAVVDSREIEQFKKEGAEHEARELSRQIRRARSSEVRLLKGLEKTHVKKGH